MYGSDKDNPDDPVGQENFIKALGDAIAQDVRGVPNLSPNIVMGYGDPMFARGVAARMIKEGVIKADCQEQVMSSNPSPDLLVTTTLPIPWSGSAAQIGQESRQGWNLGSDPGSTGGRESIGYPQDTPQQTDSATQATPQWVSEIAKAKGWRYPDNLPSSYTREGLLWLRYNPPPPDDDVARPWRSDQADDATTAAQPQQEFIPRMSLANFADTYADLTPQPPPMRPRRY